MRRDGPITLDEIGPTFARLLDGPLLLAVSGGVDSMALMHLVADWCGSKPGAEANASLLPVVATVDHGLRAESADEAAFVARDAGRRGLRHATLRWEGEKPSTGIQEAARLARYRLLAAFAATGPGARRLIVTAHHQDDVAETFLMRLARGSGVRGLSAMSERGPLPPGSEAEIGMGATSRSRVCPLLAFPKARLVATLAARGLEWIEDPSNANPDFERVRVRRAAEALAALGLTNEKIALSALRLARAGEAVTWGKAALSQRAVDHHGGAFASIDMSSLMLEAPEAAAIAVLAEVIAAHGGQREPPRLSQIETLYEALRSAWPEPSSLDASLRPKKYFLQSLGGCLVEAGQQGQRGSGARLGRHLHIYREVRRGGLPVLKIGPGMSAFWDRRFAVSTDARALRSLVVRALTPGELRKLRDRYPQFAGALPEPAILALPAFWSGDDFVALPTLQLRTAADGPALAGAARVRFLDGRT